MRKTTTSTVGRARATARLAITGPADSVESPWPAKDLLEEGRGALDAGVCGSLCPPTVPSSSCKGRANSSQRRKGRGGWRALLATPRPSRRSTERRPAFVSFNELLVGPQETRAEPERVRDLLGVLRLPDRLALGGHVLTSQSRAAQFVLLATALSPRACRARRIVRAVRATRELLAPDVAAHWLQS